LQCSKKDHFRSKAKRESQTISDEIYTPGAHFVDMIYGNVQVMGIELDFSTKGDKSNKDMGKVIAG
jgi:hypothetical protein